MSKTRHMYTRQSCSDLESTEHPGGEIWACEFYTIKVIDDAIGTMLSRKTRLKKVELQQLSNQDIYIHKTIPLGFGKR